VPTKKWVAGSLLLLTLLASLTLARADGVRSCVLNDVTYSNIFDVRADSLGDVIVLYKGGGFKAHRGELSSDFLQSWGLTVPQADLAASRTNSGSWVSTLETGTSPYPFP
jgi:hypothetical protein